MRSGAVSGRKYRIVSLPRGSANSERKCYGAIHYLYAKLLRQATDANQAAKQGLVLAQEKAGKDVAQGGSQREEAIGGDAGQIGTKSAAHSRLDHPVFPEGEQKGGRRFLLQVKRGGSRAAVFMENVVPGVLQRLRAADIIRMAGLTTASLGQEYCRIGAVHSTQRQEARIIGIVDVPYVQDDEAPPAHNEIKAVTKLHHYQVEVEMQGPTKWASTCPCGHSVATLCAHAAALLYQWLARPTAFAPVLASISLDEEAIEKEPAQDTEPGARPVRSPKPSKPIMFLRGSTPQIRTLDILVQLGLSDLRGIAREYEMISNGLNKSQLAQAIVTTLSQPEAIRRIATTLEKPQRQLLAAITLAGGSVADEDLRGLYERFSLGHANQLQSILVTLQNKALLFRTNLNNISQQRISLSGGLLDIGWYVPTEVRAALRVMVPSLSYNVAQADERG